MGSEIGCRRVALTRCGPRVRSVSIFAECQRRPRARVLYRVDAALGWVTLSPHEQNLRFADRRRRPWHHMDQQPRPLRAPHPLRRQSPDLGRARQVLFPRQYCHILGLSDTGNTAGSWRVQRNFTRSNPTFAALQSRMVAPACRHGRVLSRQHMQDDAADRRRRVARAIYDAATDATELIFTNGRKRRVDL